ncbi:DUF4315 family protein [Enterococcus plantarum]|uniref:DUF4315 family protein n=1 Tax=Enterococcus plantarum TaxID=1077675 RepID=UPI001A8E08B6|nr:DUF4315 family protein [Enterococcus plantarum]MBO0468555.1 DUF4315 family protein [Enterococcus plantarum]
MAMKVSTIDKEIGKTKEKIQKLQSKLRNLERQKIEEENLTIIKLVRSYHLDQDELAQFLKGKLDLEHQNKGKESEITQ